MSDTRIVGINYSDGSQTDRSMDGRSLLVEHHRLRSFAMTVTRCNCMAHCQASRKQITSASRSPCVTIWISLGIISTAIGSRDDENGSPNRPAETTRFVDITLSQRFARCLIPNVYAFFQTAEGLKSMLVEVKISESNFRVGASDIIF